MRRTDLSLRSIKPPVTALAARPASPKLQSSGAIADGDMPLCELTLGLNIGESHEMSGERQYRSGKYAQEPRA